MRRHPLLPAFLATLLAVAVLMPDAVAGAIGDTTTTDSTTTTATTDVPPTPPTTPATTPATSTPPTIVPATRGTAVQVIPTQPPPPTTAKPVPPPPPPPTALPANSGAGRRVVYSKSRMRVWIVEADGRVARTYLVSGKVTQPPLGTFSVFSRSSFTCSIKSSSTCMRWMVRFTKGPSGDNIGFHEIPRKNGVPLQSDSQLGQALSGGCVRQATADALFMWNWAGIGTRVVVIW
jgi:hypothetical protein